MYLFQLSFVQLIFFYIIIGMIIIYFLIDFYKFIINKNENNNDDFIDKKIVSSFDNSNYIENNLKEDFAKRIEKKNNDITLLKLEIENLKKYDSSNYEIKRLNRERKFAIDDLNDKINENQKLYFKINNLETEIMRLNKVLDSFKLNNESIIDVKNYNLILSQNEKLEKSLKSQRTKIMNLNSTISALKKEKKPR